MPFFDPVTAFAAKNADNSAGFRTPATYFGVELAKTEKPGMPAAIDADFLLHDAIKNFGPTASNLNSFNHWIKVTLPAQIEARRILHGDGSDARVFMFTNVRVAKPVIAGTNVPLFPHRARRNMLTYYSIVTADSISYGENDPKQIPTIVERDVEVAWLPVMIGSVACNLYGYTPAMLKAVFEDANDPFGYFVVKGSERIILLQENLAYGKYITTVKKGPQPTEPEAVDFKNVKTAVTTQDVAGSTYVSVSAAKWPHLNVQIFQRGLKGAAVKRYPFFVLLDIILQISSRRRYGYDILGAADLSDSDSEPGDDAGETFRPCRFGAGDGAGDEPPTASAKKRLRVVQYALSVIDRVVPAEFADSVKFSLSSSMAKYASIPSPFKYVINKLDSSARRTEDTRDWDVRIEELVSYLFPNMDTMSKAEAITRIVIQHIRCTDGTRKFDDRDAWGNKRVKLAHENIAQVINGHFKISIDPKTPERPRLVSHVKELFGVLVVSFGSAGFNGRKDSVESVRRANQTIVTSTIGRINPNANKQTKQMIIRMVHPSSLGYVCPYETPTGSGCGLTKNMACTAGVSIQRDSLKFEAEILWPTLTALGYDRAKNATSYSKSAGRIHAIVLNGATLAWCDMGRVEAFLRARTKRSDEFFDVEIVAEPSESALTIYTSGGRPIRPLLTTNEAVLPSRLAIASPDIRGREAAGVMDYVRAGAIEIVSAEEQSRATIAYSLERLDAIFAARADDPDIGMVDGRILPVYAEFDPVSMFGVAAGLMPYQNTCQGPRVTYQSNMINQSLGNHHDSYYARFDSSSKRSEASRALLETRLSEPIGSNRAPSGKMLMVAIIALANNGEDGIVAQRESFERYRTIKYATHKVVIKLVSGEENASDRIAAPSEAMRAAKTNLYHAIGDDGLPIIGRYVNKGDCIISRFKESSSNTGIETAPASLFVSVGEEGVIERVDVATNQTEKVIRVKVRQNRPIFSGDKLASRYSQKGTISAQRSSTGYMTHSTHDEGTERVDESGARAIDESLEEVHDRSSFARTIPVVASGPFAGVVPDIIINPHSQPTRMTVGMMYEMLASKASLFTGERIDGTAYRQPSMADVERFGDILEANGCDRDGFEEMRHPDGTPMRNGLRIFMGPCYYQFLHTVSDKIQFRARGKVMHLTQQPVGGRARSGGLRNGEMERTAMCSWGATSLLLDRLKSSSDQYPFEICTTCGNQAYVHHAMNAKACRVCGKDANIGIVDTTYVSVLINRMLLALGIQSTYSGVKAIGPGELE